MAAKMIPYYNNIFSRTIGQQGHVLSSIPGTNIHVLILQNYPPKSSRKHIFLSSERGRSNFLVPKRAPLEKVESRSANRREKIEDHKALIR